MIAPNFYFCNRGFKSRFFEVKVRISHPMLDVIDER